ncbi:MAG TPA: hypothetical protein VGQ67_15330 [Candidatus Polarisedimenticolia bacterium]|jgi:uncharacterized protein (UPF0333 family)|nr:hypothetical protein [Candidatus Polarisedimenticolia bacterium]
MKKLSLLFVVLAVVALVAAPVFAEGAKKHHDVQVTVVSVDPAAKTMTVKGPDGAQKTVPVTGEAVGKVKNVKPGDMITVVCQDNEKGEHEAISDIKMEKADKK